MTKKNIDKEFQKEIEKSIKMFDVAKPGSSRPASTSRPVIVGHSNSVGADPMVTKDAPSTAPNEGIEVTRKKPAPKPKPKKTTVIVKHETESASEPAAPSVVPTRRFQSDSEAPAEEGTLAQKPLEPPSHKTKKIEPISVTESVPEPVAKPENTPDTIEKAKEPVQAEAEVKEDVKLPEVPIEETPKSGVVDTLVDQVTDKKKEEKEIADVAIRIEEVQKSIDSHEFYLPIKTSEQKRNMRVTILILLAVILIGSLGFFAYSQGYIGPNKQTDDAASVPASNQTAPAAKQATQVATQQKTIGVSLTHPATWQETTTPEGQYDDKGLASIVLLAPAEKVSYTEKLGEGPNSKSTSITAQMRLRITRAKDAASMQRLEAARGIAYTTCQKQGITIAGNQEFLTTLTSLDNTDPSVQLIIGKNNCTKSSLGKLTASRFNQLQGLHSNTWIQIDYRMSEDSSNTIGLGFTSSDLDSYSPTVNPEAFTGATDKQALAIISTIKQYGN